MSLRPGPAMLAAGGVVVALALLTLAWPAVATWGLVPVLVLSIAAALRDYVALRTGLGRLTVARHLPAVVGRGRAFDAVLEITNADERAWSGTVRDVLPADAVPAVVPGSAGVSPAPDAAETAALPANGFTAAVPATWIVPVDLPPGGLAVELRQEFRIPRRGQHAFGPVWVRLRGPWRMLEGQRAMDCPATLRVLPEEFVQYAELHKESADELRQLDQIRHSRQRGAGTEFESLAEYREGDDPRRVDWRATARQRRPIVRRFQVERHRDLMILLDCGRLMGSLTGEGTKLDRAVDAALMLGRVAVLSGDRCGLGVFDDRVRGYLPPQGGPRAVSILSNSICALESEFRETDFGLMFARLQSRQHKRALVVVLSDVVDADTSVRYRASLAQLAQRHVVLFAALRTPLLRQWQHTPARTLLDGYRSAVTFRLLRERERVLHALRFRGVHVLDVEPSQLTVPLINEYIDLRRRNLV